MDKRNVSSEFYNILSKVNHETLFIKINRILSKFKHGSVIYFISNGQYVKIGKTDDFITRLKTLQTGSPHRLLPLAFIPTPKREVYNVEAELHKSFEANHVRGEWYKLSDKDIYGVISDSPYPAIQLIDYYSNYPTRLGYVGINVDLLNERLWSSYTRSIYVQSLWDNSQKYIDDIYTDVNIHSLAHSYGKKYFVGTKAV